ncbi:tRNA (adenosine(37)-N6)-threonylcarbamoyltransferase complex dimerization subunit type 1 TsaB [Phenylobacterium hankyongense]|uniref:tRNA (adenosine(37)-N6)-threonylcarbamoyltransferase complex dimerization subunit type 1 TsaB n=1 Tax=Phenylobacterium hankyongense TaxID=1813876 RepID=UPI001A9E44AE|nr:tRNA (adenosine(37)-N6)-threonylcarbamoyltransferase complex dimerization subunit type 1 TsaB [Phenylobacterium hankyongense]
MVLGLDTCLNACSVAVLQDGRALAHESEVMARGHQERLAPMAQRAMQAAGLGFDRLERIGVTVGPGSFTGLRVGLAFGKGLGAALGVPVIGVGTLEALGAEAEGLVFAAVDARRDQVYLQAFEAGRALMAPDVLPVETACARVAELAMGRSPTFVGSGGPLLAGVAPGARLVASEGADARIVARLAAGRDAAPPRPLYLRAPDARLPA